MNNIIDIMNKLNHLKDISSTKEKESIINKYKDDELFMYILEFLCNKDKITGISTKKINKEITIENNKELINLVDIKELIEFVLNNTTGDDVTVKSIQESIKNNYPEEVQEFIKEIITKKYRCGVNAKTLNKVIPGLIREFNVMLAEKYKDHKKMFINNEVEFAITLKLDGIRVILERNEDNIIFKTRQGKVIEHLIELEKEAISLPIGIYDGELLATGNFNNSQDRYKETIKRVTIKGEKTGLEMICFDLIDIEGFKAGIDNTPYKERNNKLYNILRNNNEDIEEIEDNYKYFKYLDVEYIGKDSSVIKEYFKTAIELNEEGLMINITDAPYECKRTKYLLKYKEFKTADVLVTDIIEGTGKYKNKLGAIQVECIIEKGGKEYKCLSDIGSGFTDEQREKYWNNKDLLMNKIVEIEFFEITKNEKGIYSFRFPTWKDRIRIDKETTHVD